MRYILGVDGGGTKTRAVILQDRQECLRAETGGINYNSYTKEQIRTHLNELAGKCQKAGFAPKECMGIGVGAAGISNPEAVSFLKECLAECGFMCPVSIFGDHEAALRGGLLKEPGILLIAGTGSICFAQNGAGEKKRVGGYGHLIDDGGSAYAVGRDILRAVVRARDGRKLRTELTEAVFERLGLRTIEDLVGYVYCPETGKKEIAQLATLLTEERIQRDACCREIAQTAAHELCELIVPAAQWLKDIEPEKEGNYPVLLAGSVLENNVMIRTFWEEEILKKQVPVYMGQRKKDAAYGAASLFLDKAGWQLS